MDHDNLKQQPQDHSPDRPLAPDAEQKTQSQLLTRLIVGQTIAVAALTVMTTAGGLMMPESGLLSTTPLALIAVVVGLVALWLTRRRRATLGSYVFFVGTCLAITVNVAIRGYQDGSGIYYLWPILGAMLVMEGKGGLSVTGLAIGLYLGLVVIQRLGYQTPPLLYDPEEEILLTVGSRVMMSLLLAFLAWLSGRNLNRALSDARRTAERNRELGETLEQRLAAEREQRGHLQATVERYVAYMSEVAEGNLAARLRLDGDGGGEEESDPLHVLGHSLNDMVATTQTILRQVLGAAGNLREASAEILAATTQQASGASEQSAAISQTTTTVDEVKTIAEQSVARAQAVAGAAGRTVEVSRTGQQAVGETIASMGEIKAQVEGIAENILALSEQTQQIGEIIATVNDIAAQSNMLALNASVEAARAGEHGKGFAVVAVEVRNLAEQSRQATAQVKAILSDIQKATNATVMATEEGTKRVDRGMQLAAQAGESVEQLAGVIEESAQAATQMVAGGRQQASGVGQIAVAMQNINQSTVQSLASTRQAEKAAQELNDLARSLTEAVERYRV